MDFGLKFFELIRQKRIIDNQTREFDQWLCSKWVYYGSNTFKNYKKANCDRVCLSYREKK